MNKQAQVLREAASALVKTATERDSALQKAASLQNRLDYIERRLTCEKVAADMHTKGLNTDRDFAELVDDLEKQAEQGRLDVIAAAVEMTAPSMGTKIAYLNHEDASGPGMTRLEQFLVGSIG